MSANAFWGNIAPVIYSMMGSASRAEGWEPDKMIKRESLSIAKKRWAEGDERLHNDMAKNIYDKYIKPKYPQLIQKKKEKYLSSKKFKEMNDVDTVKKAEDKTNEYFIRIIRKAIIPAAEEYNRIWGTKSQKRA